MTGPMYNRARRDEVEPEVVEAFTAGGAFVYRMDRPVDLLVGHLGRTRLVEVKTGRSGFTEPQVEFMREWRGEPVSVCRCAADATRLLREWEVAEAVSAALVQKSNRIRFDEQEG